MANLPPPTVGPAGWYPDPLGGGVPRYFDGREWAPPEAAGPWLTPAAPPHPSLPVTAAAGALAILLVSLIGGRLVVAWLARYDWPIVAYVAVLTVVGYGPSVWWCRLASRRWGTGSLSTDIGLRFRWSDAGWGPLVWIGGVATQVACAAVVLAFDVPTSSNTDGIGEVDASRGYVIAVLVSAVVAAPVVEEMVFRGVVLRGLLSRLGPALTIALQGLLFGAAHVDPERGSGNLGLALVLCGVGVAFGTAAFLLRRVGPTIVAHAIFNAVVLVIVLSGVADTASTV
jgi:membrane protease YdiL (CAAX protease family)